MHQLSTPEQRFSALLADAGPRPFVTYYDETSGERTELSVRSLANWVAKTHHLLGTELGLGPGDRALLALPAHWISVPVLLGCLTAGLSLAADGDAEVAFAAPGADLGTIPDVFGVAPSSAAVGLGDAVPDGWTDYVLAVRPQADAWATVSLPAGPDDPCLPGLSRAETLAAAAERAAALGLSAGGRLLTTRGWSGPDDWLTAVLAPLAIGGSVVVVRNADAATVERRAGQERATASDTPGTSGTPATP